MASKKQETREVMNIRQASEYLGISPDTLYPLAIAGAIPAFKIGNRWKFNKNLMDKWMEQQSQRKKKGS